MSERSLEDELLHPSKVHAYFPVSIEQILDRPFPPRPDVPWGYEDGTFEMYWAPLGIRVVRPDVIQPQEYRWGPNGRCFEAPE